MMVERGFWIALAVLCFVAGCGESPPREVLSLPTDEIDNSDSHTVYYSNDSIYSTGAIMTWNEDKREIAFPGKLEDCTAYGDGRVRCIVDKTE